MTIETFHLTRAIALYRKGWTAKAIASDQGCSLSTVYTRLREAGIKRRPSASATHARSITIALKPRRPAM